MKRFLLSIVLLLSILTQGLVPASGMFGVTNLSGFGVGSDAVAAGPVTCTYVTALSNTGNLSTYTFTAASIGTAAAGRIIVVVTHQVATTGPNTAPTSLTIDGVTATLAGSAWMEDATMTAIYYLVDATGTTADIVINEAEAQNRAAIGIWAVYDANATPTDTDGTNANASTISITALTIPSNGCGIAGSSITAAGSATTTWTGMTERHDTYVETSMDASGADDNTPGTPTITAAGGPIRDRSMAGVAFGP